MKGSYSQRVVCSLNPNPSQVSTEAESFKTLLMRLVRVNPKPQTLNPKLQIPSTLISK